MKIAAKLDTALQQIIETFELAGMAVGIVKDNNIAYARGFGVQNIDTLSPITPNSVFYLASISKTFVAAAIVQLLAAGKLDLQATVSQYLPYFALRDDRHRAITIQQLLSHTAGMPDIEDYHWDKPEYDDGALERYVRSIKDQTLQSAPGESFAYSNMAYDVLGDVIAKVTNHPFETYIKENIFEPLQMENATFFKPAIAPELGTTPHVRMPDLQVSPVYPYNRSHAPSSTCHSSLVDLCNWAMMHLNGGNFRGKHVLSPKMFDLLWHPFHTLEDGDSEFIGLSWTIELYDGTKRYIYHEGGDIGFLTNLVLLPEESAAIIVLVNSALAPIWPITDLIFAHLLGTDAPIPKQPVLIPLSHTYKEKGLPAAIQQGQTLRQNHADQYDFSADYFYFPAHHALIDLKQADAAIDISTLWTAVHPDSDLAYQYLGWAHIQSGNLDLAMQHLRYAIDLNPKNDEVAKLIETISHQVH